MAASIVVGDNPGPVKFTCYPDFPEDKWMSMA